MIKGFFFQAEDGIRDGHVTGVQTCALPIFIIVSFFISVFLSVKLNNRKTIKILFLLSLAFGKLDKTDKIKIIKGLKVDIFQRSGLKDTTCPLIVFKRIRLQNPLCGGGRSLVGLYL